MPSRIGLSQLASHPSLMRLGIAVKATIGVDWLWLRTPDRAWGSDGGDTERFNRRATAASVISGR
jgi:hypothetical protein